jgi:hypothetical protein
MSALEPGRLYMAKCAGEPERLLFVETGGWADDMDGTVWNPDCITDARPLIVLDLDDPQRLVTILRANCLWGLADQIEAQTKPARIPEPGLWGVVEAVARGCGQTRFTFVRVSLEASLGQWVDVEDGSSLDWSELIDPTLIRDGIES